MQTKSVFSLLGIFCLTLAIDRVWAATPQLIWDPLGNNGGAGSGNWDTTPGNNVWWNGTSDVAWTQSSTTAGLNGATFNGPDAAPGTYVVSLDAGQVAVTNNLFINNNGYLFSGAGSIYICSTNYLNVAANKTVTFNCNMAGSGTSPYWVLGSGATMNVEGNLTSGQQVRLAGGPTSAFNLGGNASSVAIPFILAPVNVTNGSFSSTGNFFVGYTDPATINGTAYTAGSITVTNATVTENGGIFIMGRSFGGSSGGQGTLTLQNGSVVNIGTTKAENLDLCYDGASANSATVNVQGGTLTVGASGFQTSLIAFFAAAASVAGETAVLNQTGGTIIAWGGISIAPSGGSGGSASVTQSNGTLYLGPNGITVSAAYNGSFNISLTGGTVGALANWSSSLPLTLGTANGNTTFQCADSGLAPHNISLSGALTGSGGLYVTGTGTLTLSGANNYAGNTVVSNGTLAIVTGPSPMVNGPVTLDASTGSPAVAVTATRPGQYWTNNGTLTFQNATGGAPSLNFQFGALAPSTTVAPIQVAGNVAFTATPSVNVGGGAIAVGTYPLITYTGATNGTMPTTVMLTGVTGSGYITNIAASKTIALVVTSSSYNPALYWRIGSGVWDINTTANWTQFDSPAKYTDGNAVIFDDSASGPSPITVTLNTTVNPLDVTFNNAAPTNYTIAGTGSITGNGSLTLLGTGKVTLSGTNNYSGGTVIGGGSQLNINNGGNGSSSAVGTGPLAINTGATIDNTSGADITLQPSISETWNGNFTYLGSSNNFNTGLGSVTLNANVSLAVNSNNFTVGGQILDGGQNYQLAKTGNGALTLATGNTFGGGLALYSGLLNIADPVGQCLGMGPFTIYGGAIDNVTGAPLTLQPITSPASYIWAGNFSFVGSASLD